MGIHQKDYPICYLFVFAGSGGDGGLYELRRLAERRGISVFPDGDLYGAGDNDFARGVIFTEGAEKAFGEPLRKGRNEYYGNGYYDHLDDYWGDWCCDWGSSFG